MKYALRKLIAFVFLGGMFWFIYQDLDNLAETWFMQALGLLAVAFAICWLLIPIIVVRYRIHCRRRQNKERYAQWRAEVGNGEPRPLAEEARHLALEPGERLYVHEKGTLYAPKGVGLGDATLEGRPSEVAFPSFSRRCSRIQRTHCYVTNHKLVFVGKALSWNVPLSDLKSFVGAPGGLVFKVVRNGRLVRVAFTFQNPLVVADILKFVRRIAVSGSKPA